MSQMMSRTLRSCLTPRARIALAALGIGLCTAGSALAQPIQGPEDQACRDEATRRVMGEQSAVDPYVRGRQYWSACMARSGSAAAPAGAKAGRAAARRGGKAAMTRVATRGKGKGKARRR